MLDVKLRRSTLRGNCVRRLIEAVLLLIYDFARVNNCLKPSIRCFEPDLLPTIRHWFIPWVQRAPDHQPQTWSLFFSRHSFLSDGMLLSDSMCNELHTGFRMPCVGIFDRPTYLSLASMPASYSNGWKPVNALKYVSLLIINASDVLWIYPVNLSDRWYLRTKVSDDSLALGDDFLELITPRCLWYLSLINVFFPWCWRDRERTLTFMATKTHMPQLIQPYTTHTHSGHNFRANQLSSDKVSDRVPEPAF